MKNLFSFSLKAALLSGLFSMAFLITNAQTTPSGPAWTTSKDVQKIQNKKLFEDEDLKRSHIQVASRDFPSIAISKGIHQKATSEKAPGNIVSKGYPDWIISKGVKRIEMKH